MTTKLEAGTKFEVIEPVMGDALHVRWGCACEYVRHVPPGCYEVASVGHGTATLLPLLGDVKSSKHSYVVGLEGLRTSLRRTS